MLWAISLLIRLLKIETCDFSHNFLLSIQSYSFSPVIDKPTRVKWLQEGLNQTLASRAELTLCYSSRLTQPRQLGNALYSRSTCWNTIFPIH